MKKNIYASACRLLFLAASSLLTTALVAQTPAYFPLQVGNSWLYRLKNSRAGEDRYRSISVEGRETIGGREYFTVNYMGRTLALRSNSDGSIVVFDRASGTDQPFLLLVGLPEGASFPTVIDQCTRSGRVDSISAVVRTPAGEFSNVLLISYQLECADAGITQQYYAPGVGLVLHQETSFAGPREYELVYYRTETSSGAGQEVSFSVGLDSSRYLPNSNLGVRLTLRSMGPDPLLLVFPSSQTYDLKVINELGTAVYVWSADKLFAAVYREEKFGPGERTYGVTAPLGNLRPGKYKVQAYLTTNPLRFLGEVGFEVVLPSGVTAE